MERSEQIRVGNEIIGCFATDLQKMIQVIPEEWNGFEIRQLAVDYFNREYNVPLHSAFANKRTLWRKNYENEKDKVARLAKSIELPKEEKQIYTVLDLGGGLVQEICTFTDEALANRTFVDWVNEAYGTTFTPDQVEEAQEYNSDNDNGKQDIRYFVTTANDTVPQTL